MIDKVIGVPLMSFAFIVALSVPLSVSAESSEASEKSKSSDVTYELERKPRLRVLGKPVGTWERYTATRLTRVSLTLKNVTDVDADDVWAQVTVPGGAIVKLKGPPTLGPYQQAEYTASCYETITIQGDLKPSVGCTNCMR